MTKFKKNFKSKLHFACSTNDLRPAFQNIEFKNGFAYATNGHIAIKQHLNLHDFDVDEIKHLESKVVHRNTFIEILKYDIVTITKNGFECRKNNVKCTFPFVEHDFKMPDIESVIPSLKSAANKNIGAIGIDAKFLQTFNDLFVFDGDKKIKLDFSATNKAIRLTTLNMNDEAGENQIGIIMPVMFNL